MDGAMKLAKPAFVVQATVQLGYPESTIVGIGLTLLVCTLLYLIPRTAVLGAVLLTGYLGGAVASNVRAAMPLFNTVSDPVWGIAVGGVIAARQPGSKSAAGDPRRAILAESCRF